MKSSILRAVIAVIAGVLLVQYREEMAKWLTIAIGVLFFLSGLISVVFYCVMRKKYDKDKVIEEYTYKNKANATRKPMVPIVGLGCAILGIILALIPETVANYLVYVFAVILILGAIGQFFILISSMTLLRDLEKLASDKVVMRCGYIYWVLPILLFVFGLLAIFYPRAIASAPFLFIGIAMMVYGLSELISSIKSFSVRKYVVRNQGPDNITPENATPTSEIEHIENIEIVESGENIEDAEIVEDEP